MGNIEEINIINQTYYLFDDMINIKDFDPNLLKIQKYRYLLHWIRDYERF